ncbi:MAG TPA: SPOR domain-containing protein [Methylophilaceae bacterium]|nr:SPOR domain-containing protein [Methylophilaceae bacterium]
MQNDQVDSSLSFKKRARRRLVGAIALVLLMVIILPMMLEDREKVVQEDVEIIMSPSPSDLEASAGIETENLADVEEVIIQQPASEETDLKESLEMPDVDKPTITQEITKTEKSETKETARTNAKVSNGSVNGKGYYVQIGVFSNPENIKKLQLKLSDLGYRSLTEKISTDTGVKTRLRTESFNERNEAAIALQNIKDSGLAGMVVSQK